MTNLLLTNSSVDKKILLFVILVVSFPLLVPLPMVAPLLFVLLGLMIGFLMISFMEKEEDRNFLLKMFIYAYLLRILVAFFLHMLTHSWEYGRFAFGTTQGYHGFFIGDGWGYSENGWIIANRLKAEFLIGPLMTKQMSLSGTLHVYDYINGLIYYCVGKSPLTVLFLNCTVGSLTLIFMYRIAALVFGRESAKVTVLLCAFWPSLFLWSTQNLKEPLTIFLVTACFWASISFLKGFNPIYLMLSVLMVFLLSKFRPLIGTVAMISLGLHLVFLVYRLVKRDFFSILIVIAIFALMVITSIEFRGIVNKFFNVTQNLNFLIEDVLREIEYNRKVRAMSNLAILPSYFVTSPRALLNYLPIGLTCVFFAPFPWQLFSSSQIFATPEMLVWYIAIPYFISGVYLAIRNNLKYLFSLLVYSGGILLMLALFEGNIGTMFRHRALALNFLLMFIAVGINAAKKGPATIHER